ncbi:reverse transcriptase domain-containing protein, partial [Tanacetum coccineum]
MTDDQLKVLISQGVADVLVKREATRSRNGKDNHDLGPGDRRTERVAREYTYPDFMKCQPLNFKGTEGVAENKRKLDNKNQTQQQPPKKQGVAIAYTVGSGERKEYVGTLPLCYKCKFHHNGPCTAKCANCKKVGHLTRDCWNPTATNNQRNLTCYECGNQGHYRSDCPELKNQNHGNQAG